MSEMTNVRQNLPPTRSVVVLTPAGGQLIGIIGFLEALDSANRFRVSMSKPPPYEVQLVGVDAQTASASGPVLSTPPSSGVRSVHTLVLGGGLQHAEGLDPRFLAEASRLAGLAERLVGVCMGTFALAELGLLDGRCCTTHWMGLDRLRERFPEARVEGDAIFCEDGRVLTSAGATAGIDLALHLIRSDCGPRLALAVARSLVVFAQRPGGQSQFSAVMEMRPGADDRLNGVIAGVVSDPAADHGVDAMARRAGMSPRHFARVFRDQTGETPAAFVTRARVEAAQRALAGGDASMEQVADAAGFGSVDAFRRSFGRVTGVSPSAWRERFANP